MRKSSLLLAPLFSTLLIYLIGWPTTLSAAESLAAVVRPILPKGWMLTERDTQVILERSEQVGLYNGLGLPYFKSDEELRTYVKSNVKYEKLVITLWLGERVGPAEIKRIKEHNANAEQRARTDRNNGKFIPNAEFWKQHPEYGYLDTPLPILDTGTQGVYMDCPSGAILQPTREQRRGRGRIKAYFDKDVEHECQGVIDALGKIYTPY